MRTSLNKGSAGQSRSQEMPLRSDIGHRQAVVWQKRIC
jgi:hypothetical protein